MKLYININLKYILIVLFAIGVLEGASGQSLQKLIDMGLKNNQGVQKAELTYNLASEKINEQNTFSNTEFGFGYFVSEPETRTGPQKFKVSVRQMIPWFGSVTSRTAYASALADSEYETLAIAKRQLVLTLSQDYFDLWAIAEKLKIVSEQMALLNTYEKLALSGVEVGKTSAVAVLKLQMRSNDLKQEEAVLQEQYLAKQAEINLKLNRGKDIAIIITEQLIMPSVPTLQVDAVSTIHPELLQYDKLYHSVEQLEQLNEKDAAPLLGFGLDYINVDKRSDMVVSENGKDIVMPMISVSIPIFNSKFKSKEQQYHIQKSIYQTQKTERLNTLNTVLEQAIKSRNSAGIIYTTQQENCKQARYAQEIVMKSYETGMVDFTEVLDLQELQLKYEKQAIDAVTDYYKQQTIIQYLTQ